MRNQKTIITHRSEKTYLDATRLEAALEIRLSEHPYIFIIDCSFSTEDFLEKIDNNLNNFM